MEELKDVLRETLENRGALGNVRAHLRAEVSNYGVSDRAGARTWNRLYDGWSLSWMYTAGSQHRCTVTSNFTMATT